MLTGPSFERGAVIGGDFVVVRLLGQGGMGAVYGAEQTSTGKLRALKIMRRDIAPDATLQRRFEQEAKVGSLIKSGHVVEVIAAGIDAALGVPYLVMELLEGSDLRRHVEERHHLPAAEVRAIFAQLCHGVAAAHAVGLVHRDLKPENIFLARPNRAESEESVVKVLDFGIAKLAAETGTRATAAIGSPLWMAPEQTTPGPVTPAADVWALGLIAYELFTGEHFWRAAATPTATPMHLLREIVLDPIPPASERGGDRLPSGFDEWFRRCLARAPGERFQDAAELWHAMQRFLPEAVNVQGGHTRRDPTDPFAPTATALPVLPSEPPPARPPGTTPLVVVAQSVPPDGGPPTQPRESVARSHGVWIVAASVGLAGLLGGVSIGECRAPNVTVTVPTTASSAGAFVTTTESSVRVSSLPSIPPVPSTVMPSLAPTPPAPPKRLAAQTGGDDRPSLGRPPPLRDGFSNPHDPARQGDDIDGPRQSVVQGHHVRLFTRLVSNGSNVADSVVRSAIDYSSWEYGRCYERAFGATKDLPDGTVMVAFDVLDQLPRHATLQSSTFGGTVMSPCVVQTLSGQTINAAGRDGAGHVVYGFRFVVTD